MTTAFWYCTEGEAELGPFTADELRDRVEAGLLHPSDDIWRPGLDEWIAAREVEGLFEPVEAAGPRVATSTGDVGEVGEVGELAEIDLDDDDDELTFPVEHDTPRVREVGGPLADRLAGHEEIEYARFLTRAVASLLDGLILAVVQIPLQAVFFLSQPPLNTLQLTAFQRDALEWVLLVVGQVLPLAYSVWLLGGPSQATFGMRALKIHIEQIDGDRPGRWRLVGRHLVSLVSYFMLTIGYLMQPFTPRKQTLHDLVCGTVVVMDEASE